MDPLISETLSNEEIFQSINTDTTTRPSRDDEDPRQGPEDDARVLQSDRPGRTAAQSRVQPRMGSVAEFEEADPSTPIENSTRRGDGSHTTLSSSETQLRSSAFRKKLSAGSVHGSGSTHGADVRDGSKYRPTGCRSSGLNNDDDESEDEGDGDEEDAGGLRVSRLDSAGFDAIMDTLAQQPKRNLNQCIPVEDVDLGVAAFDTQFNLHNPHARISAACYEAQGDRPEQEDRFTVIPDLTVIANLPTPASIQCPGGYGFQHFSFFGMYDGHNGWQSSEALQQTMHEALFRQPTFYSAPDEAMHAACTQVDREICARCKSKDDTSGSTGLAVVYDGVRDQLVVGNVGDSRCVLSRNGLAVELSCDHRLSKRPDEKQRYERPPHRVLVGTNSLDCTGTVPGSKRWAAV